MNNVRISTTIKIKSMDELKELLSKQHKLLAELNKNAAEIESVERNINIELSMEKATQ